MMKDWRTLQKEYFCALEDYFEEWSERYTDLRLTTDIRVATWKGKRIKSSAEKGKWWFREALGAQDESGKLLREQIVILGDPGGGKSTACQRATWELAREGRDALDSQRRPVTPVYLELGAYRKDSPQLKGLAPSQRMLKLLSLRIERFLGDVQLNWTQLQTYMGSCPFLFFLDGLNEVGQNQRDALIADIKDFIERFKGQEHQFVLTTRKFDYEYDFVQHFPTDQFEPLEILELDSAGVNEFIMRDLGQIAQAYAFVDNLPTEQQAIAKATLDALKIGDVTTGKNFLLELQQLFENDPDIVSSLKAAQTLLDILRRPEYERVLWLAQNPGTLRDIIDVYQDKGSIPRSRSRLSEQAIQARLRAQAAKRFERNEQEFFRLATKFDALQAIAFHMIDVNKGLNITHQDLIAIFQEHVHQEEAELLLNELIFSDSLLVEPEEKWYAFVKQPYQEYFAARELRDRWLAILKEGRDPLRDHRMQKFLQNRVYFQVTSAMSGLLTKQQVLTLVTDLRKHKSTQRLAALCVRHAEELPSDFVDEFIAWTRQHILKFTLLPEGITNIVLVFITMSMLVFFWNVDLRAIPVNLALVISEITSKQPSYAIEVTGGVIVTALSISIRLILQRVYGFAGIVSQIWSRFDSGLVLLTATSLPIAILGIAGSNLGVAMNLLSMIALLALAVRLAYLVVLPGANWVNIRLEEYIVNHGLIRYLEILRDMGPNATSAITEIQEELTKNRNVSERIKDTIKRTWALSPRTVLQLIEDVNKPARQAEIVKVIGPIVLQPETDYTIQKRCVAALFHIVEQAASIGAVMAAIDVLGRLAREGFAYRNRIYALLKQVVYDPKYPLAVRWKARRALYNLGWRDSWWPRPTLREALRTWGPAIVFILLPLLWVVASWIISFFI